MADLVKCDIMIEADKELKRQIRGIPWERFLPYGSVKIQIREGKPSLITLERTLLPD